MHLRSILKLNCLVGWCLVFGVLHVFWVSARGQMWRWGRSCPLPFRSVCFPGPLHCWSWSPGCPARAAVSWAPPALSSARFGAPGSGLRSLVHADLSFVQVINMDPFDHSDSNCTFTYACVCVCLCPTCVGALRGRNRTLEPRGSSSGSWGCRVREGSTPAISPARPLRWGLRWAWAPSWAGWTGRGLHFPELG